MNDYIPQPTGEWRIDFGADPVGIGVGVGVTLSCLHNILRTRVWIHTKFSWIYNLDITKNWLDFADLDQNFKVTAVEKLNIHGWWGRGRRTNREVITKTCLYSFDPFKPHFYIVKLGFTGVYIIFLISAQNIDCGYSLEPPRRCGSSEYPQSMFWAEIWKISDFFFLKTQFLVVKFSIYLNRRVFLISYPVPNCPWGAFSLR